MSAIGRSPVWNATIRLAVFALVGVIAGCGGGDRSENERANPELTAQHSATWDPGALQVTVLQGTSQLSSIRLTVNERIVDASLFVAPAIAGVMQVSLQGQTILEPSVPTNVPLELSVPASTAPGLYEGTVHVLSGTQTVPANLKVQIQVVQGSSDLVVNQVSDPSPDRIARTQSGQFLIKDEVLVVLNGGSADPAARIKEIAAEAGAQIIGSVPGSPLYQLRFPEADIETIASHRDALRQLADVKAVSLSLLGTGLINYDEGLYKDKWNDGNFAVGANRHLEFIRAPEAWNITTGLTDGGKIRVAIIDQEFDYKHRDLANNIVVDLSESSLYTMPFRPTTKADIPGGHGTAVAGTICADGDNAFGVVGVAWHYHLLLYDVTVGFFSDRMNRFLLRHDCRISSPDPRCKPILSAVKTVAMMKKAVAAKVRIVNMSIGFVEQNCGNKDACTLEPALEVLRLVHDLNEMLRVGFESDAERQILWVIAAGNEGRETKYQSPASFSEQDSGFSEQIIVVAGANVQSGTRLTGSSPSIGPAETIPIAAGGKNIGSNFGGYVDVAAPWHVSTTIPRLCEFVKSGLFETYVCDNEVKLPFGFTSYMEDFEGTSAAAPQVAGLAVLVLAKDPRRTTAQVKTCIVNAANAYGAKVVMPDNTDSGFHVINAVRAVECLSSITPPVIPVAQPIDERVHAGQTATFSVTVTSAVAPTFQWRRGTLNIAGATDSSYTTPATTIADNGAIYSVVVANSAGSTVSRNAVLTVTSAIVSPAVTSQPQGIAVTEGGAATFNVTATGTGPLSYEWRRGSHQDSVRASGVADSATYTTPPTTLGDNGTGYFVVVRNAAGPANSAVAYVTVVPNPPASSTQMTLTASADPVRAGQLVEYTATVINRSAVLLNYAITIPVPAGMSVAAGSISQGASGAPAGCGAAVCLAGSVIQWGNNTGYPAKVGAGQSLTVTFVAQVDTNNPPAAGTVIRTTASAVGDSTSASAAADVVVASAGDLSLGVVNVPTAVAPGETVSYTLRYGNPGGSAASHLALSMPLPAGTSLVAASDGGTLSNGSVIWNVGTLAAGTAGQRTLALQVAPAMAVGSAVNVAADLWDTGTGRSLARATSVAAVLASASTQMTLTASADPVRAGQLVEYTATVINRSAVLLNYAITIPVPAGMSVAAGSISQGASGAPAGCGAAVCLAGTVIQWGNNTGYPAKVGAGQSLTVTFVAQVDTNNPPVAGTVIRTTASAAGDATSASAAADVVVGP